MRSIGLLFVLAALPLTGPAFGQDICSSLSAQCACAAPLASFSAGSAVLSDMKGSVQVTAIDPGANPSAALLAVGDSALVLAGGSAKLKFGPTCAVSLNPQSSLVIRELDGCACASVVEAMTSAGVLTEGGSGAATPVGGATGAGIGNGGGGFGGSGGGLNAGLLTAGIVGTGGGIAAYLALTSDDDDDKGSLE